MAFKRLFAVAIFLLFLQVCIFHLGYILGQSPHWRDIAVEEGIVFHFSWLTKDKTPDYLLQNISWALENFCKDTDEYMDEEAIKEIIPLLAKLIQHENYDIVKHAIKAYGNLAVGHLQAVIDGGRVDKIIGLLNHTNEELQLAASVALGIFFTGKHTQIQYIFNQGALMPLVKLLIHDNPNVKANALQAIYNLVTYGNPIQIKALLNANVVPLICDFLNNCSRKIVKISMDIIHLLLEKSADIKDILGKHVNEWGGYKKMEKIMDITISRLQDEDSGDLDHGTCTR